jgi:hypothetical protein
MLLFSSQLCELLPLFPSLWFTLPTSCVKKYTVLYARIQRVKGGIWDSRPQTDKHLPQSPFTGQVFQMTIFSLPSMSLIYLRLVTVLNL